jgi:hypothetical protein
VPESASKGSPYYHYVTQKTFQHGLLGVMNHSKPGLCFVAGDYRSSGSARAEEGACQTLCFIREGEGWKSGFPLFGKVFIIRAFLEFRSFHAPRCATSPAILCTGPIYRDPSRIPFRYTNQGQFQRSDIGIGTSNPIKRAFLQS